MKNCCIWLVIYLNCTMMQGTTNFKSEVNVCNTCMPAYTIVAVKGVAEHN